MAKRYACLLHDIHVRFWRQGDRAFERHVHRGDAEWSPGQNQSIETLGHCVTDHIGRKNIRAGGQMRAMLLHAASRKNHQRALFQLRRNLGLSQIDEVSGG